MQRIARRPNTSNIAGSNPASESPMQRGIRGSRIENDQQPINRFMFWFNCELSLVNCTYLNYQLETANVF